MTDKNICILTLEIPIYPLQIISLDLESKSATWQAANPILNDLLFDDSGERVVSRRNSSGSHNSLDELKLQLHEKSRQIRRITDPGVVENDGSIWLQIYDKRYNRFFYYNPLTLQSHWKRIPQREYPCWIARIIPNNLVEILRQNVAIHAIYSEGSRLSIASPPTKEPNQFISEADAQAKAESLSQYASLAERKKSAVAEAKQIQNSIQEDPSLAQALGFATTDSSIKKRDFGSSVSIERTNLDDVFAGSLESPEIRLDAAKMSLSPNVSSETARPIDFNTLDKQLSGTTSADEPKDFTKTNEDGTTFKVDFRSKSTSFLGESNLMLDEKIEMRDDDADESEMQEDEQPSLSRLIAQSKVTITRDTSYTNVSGSINNLLTENDATEEVRGGVSAMESLENLEENTVNQSKPVSISQELEEYCSKYGNKPLGVRKTFLTGKPIPDMFFIWETISFPTQTFHKLDNSKLKQTCQSTYKVIQRLMSDKILSKNSYPGKANNLLEDLSPDMLEKAQIHLVKELINHLGISREWPTDKETQDELYTIRKETILQVCKQINQNPNPARVRDGCFLLALILGYVDPGATLRPHLKKWFETFMHQVLGATSSVSSFSQDTSKNSSTFVEETTLGTNDRLDSAIVNQSVRLLTYCCKRCDFWEVESEKEVEIEKIMFRAPCKTLIASESIKAQLKDLNLIKDNDYYGNIVSQPPSTIVIPGIINNSNLPEKWWHHALNLDNQCVIESSHFLGVAGLPKPLSNLASHAEILRLEQKSMKTKLVNTGKFEDFLSSSEWRQFRVWLNGRPLIPTLYHDRVIQSARNPKKVYTEIIGNNQTFPTLHGRCIREIVSILRIFTKQRQGSLIESKIKTIAQDILGPILFGIETPSDFPETADQEEEIYAERQSKFLVSLGLLMVQF